MGIKSTRLKEKLHAQCDVILKAKVQRSARTDKRRYLGRPLSSTRKKQGIVYRITKHLWRSGALRSTKKDQEECWAGHF